MAFPIPDNAGHQPVDEPIVPGGPAAYFATIPVRKVLEAINAADVPVKLSLTAGAHLCNQVFYVLLHHMATNDLPIPTGFIHAPALPEQVEAEERHGPSLPLETQVKGIQAALETLAESLGAG